MQTLPQLWPPYAVRIVEGDLALAVVTEADLPALTELVLAGLHDPDRMPFDQPWTQAPPKELPATWSAGTPGTSPSSRPPSST